MDDPLADTVRRAKAGDRDAFGDLVRRYSRPLVTFLTACAGADAHLAEDLAQEAFVTAHRRFDTLHDPACFKGWLYRIAFNRAMDHLRASERGRLALDALPEDRLTNASDSPRLFEVGGELRTADEAMPDVLRCLERLPREYATVLTLHYLEGLGCREIAAVLGRSVPGVKSTLHRARRAVRRMLEARARAEAAAPPHRCPRPEVRP